MTVNIPPAPHCIKLTAVSGANPLGFLAALGTLVVARQSGYPEAKLGWERSVSWTPVLDCGAAVEPMTLCQALATGMRGKQIPVEAEEKRKEAQRSFDAAKKTLADKQKEIKQRRLRGKEHKAAIDAEVLPLREAASESRQVSLEALKNAVPRAELALGRDINGTDEEYRGLASDFLIDAGHAEREAVDLLAAFSCDTPLDKYGHVTATPFCFLTGAGHQHFLETVCQLIELVTPERIQAALFEPWTYQDGRYSMRWDPVEDRRYALMEGDPSPLGSRTMWMANLLAYRALVLFPSAPSRRELGTTAWCRMDDKALAFTWPIWEHPSDPDSIRSLLQLQELGEASPDRSALAERGVAAAFRARRIRVNKYINFTPARSLFARQRAYGPRIA
jgi:hypothetical protein